MEKYQKSLEQIYDKVSEIESIIVRGDKTLRVAFRNKLTEMDCMEPIRAKNNGREVVVRPCDPRYCTGCMTCVHICPVRAIDRIIDDKGFYDIKVNTDKCINCNKCIEMCHVNIPKPILAKRPIKAYSCQSIDKDLLMESSSGGVATLLAEEIIKNEGAVFGAAYNDSFDVCHVCITNKSELGKIRGSKYVQSDLKDTFKETKNLIEKGSTVLYIGTPCQIAALKNYIGFSENLYTVDLVCHGMPSPGLFNDYKKSLSKANGIIKSINFRSKATGWREFSMEIEFESGDKYLVNRNKDMYLKAFLDEYSCKSVCYRCQYAGRERLGDITLCDFGGREEDEGFELDTGMSACMVNTQKASVLFEQIKKYMKWYEVDYEEVVNGNRPLHSPSFINKDREIFWEDYKKYGYEYVCQKWLR